MAAYQFYRIFIGILLIFAILFFFLNKQRAALAEKELSVVKEKLVSEESTRRDQANEAPPIMDTPLDVMGRPTLQLELAAKEKEVGRLFFIFFFFFLVHSFIAPPVCPPRSRLVYCWHFFPFPTKS